MPTDNFDPGPPPKLFNGLVKANKIPDVAKGIPEPTFKRQSFCAGSQEMALDQEDKELLKDIAGKPRLTLVPRKIITAIAGVREYGNMKYKTSDSWKLNSAEQYRDAAFRHFIAYLDDPDSVDAESGLPHLDHLATNIAFLIEGGFKSE